MVTPLHLLLLLHQQGSHRPSFTSLQQQTKQRTTAEIKKGRILLAEKKDATI
jgi:hypothetical protein